MINSSILTFFSSFSFVFLLILCLMGLSLNIAILRYFRINYIFIFEIEPKSRLGFNELFKSALFILSIWLLLLILMYSSINFGLFDHKYFIFSLILILFITFYILWPFHCFYFTFRKALIITLLKNIFPIGSQSVRFRDFIFGDTLTSLTRPLSSLVLSICLLGCQSCREENKMGICNRNILPAFIITLLPYIFRFNQCLNRWYYTRMKWPHMFNAIKYASGIANTAMSWCYAMNKDLFVEFLVIGTIANSYMLFWDIYVDWNLGRLSSKNFFLRDNIVYPKSMYYFAIVTDSVLRFTWLTSIPGWDFGLHDEIKIFILSILEVYRRTQWALFRIENENTNNPEKYRTILDIPQLPID